jgi:hypothetical protein
MHINNSIDFSVSMFAECKKTGIEDGPDRSVRDGAAPAMKKACGVATAGFSMRRRAARDWQVRTCG